MRVVVVVCVVIVLVLVVVMIVVKVVLGRRRRSAQFHFKGAIQGTKGRRRPGTRMFVSIVTMVPMGMRHGGF